ncbi:MAG: restriction endonuclease subunit S [Succinivibrio sp.]|nr:restriction endonuclease subunit S [Succinivibrio sp.]
MSEMKQYKVSKILSYISGNQGLTNEVIHLEKSKLNGIDDVEVLSSSVDKSFSMGFVSKNLHLHNKPIKIFEAKEGILVSRNGNAGILTYLPKGKYTMNDHAYILFIKPEFNNFLDTFYLSLQLQSETLKFLSTREGNKNWNITKFMKNGQVYIPTNSDGKFNLKAQIELANIYKQLEDKKKKLLKRISELEELMIHIDIESDIEYKDVQLNELFEPQIGNSKYTKSYCKTNEGKYPIYSANTETEFANINRYDYDGEFITWAKDGLAGYLMILKNKFSITGHRGILIPKKVLNGIDLTYIKYTLEPIFRRHKKGREGDLGKNEYTTLNSTMIKKLNIQVPIPIKPDGTFDLEKQKEIANKYRQIDEIKQGLIDKIKSLVEIKVVPCE